MLATPPVPRPGGLRFFLIIASSVAMTRGWDLDGGDHVVTIHAPRRPDRPGWSRRRHHRPSRRLGPLRLVVKFFQFFLELFFWRDQKQRGAKLILPGQYGSVLPCQKRRGNLPGGFFRGLFLHRHQAGRLGLRRRQTGRRPPDDNDFLRNRRQPRRHQPRRLFRLGRVGHDDGGQIRRIGPLPDNHRFQP